MKLHSISSIITNSSSEIFIVPYNTTITSVRNVLQKILDTIGIILPIETYFDVYIEFDRSSYYDYYDIINTDETVNDIIRTEEEYRIHREIMEKDGNDNVNEYYTLYVKSKSEEEMDIFWGLIHSVNIYEKYNG